jgi:hypothetical protein
VVAISLRFKAAHYKERLVAPQPTGFTGKTPLSTAQPVC